MPSTLPSSIPDSQLGLSQSELHILRQHQQIALSSGSSTAAPHYAHSTTSSRGRGHTRSSASTSRAASAASSGQGGGGRLLLDAGSLAMLGSHFERLMAAIQSRVNHVRFAARFKRARRSLVPSLCSHDSIIPLPVVALYSATARSYLFS